MCLISTGGYINFNDDENGESWQTNNQKKKISEWDLYEVTYILDREIDFEVQDSKYVSMGYDEEW